MNLLQKIYNSRKVLKQLLSNEWIVDDINELSLEELKIMYENSNDKAYLNSPCNITLQNKYIPSHKLHIIYYNFPELNRSGVKVNKTCCDKLTSMYKTEIDEEDEKIFEKEDSLLVIINEPVSESMAKSVESVYHAGQDTLTKSGISTQITGEMKENDFIMNQSYFRNIHMFHIDIITVNILNHTLVPLHEPIRKQDEIDKILQLTNSTEHQLPIILRTDNIAKLIRLCPGNICKINRNSQKCGEYTYFRICR